MDRSKRDELLSVIGDVNNREEGHVLVTLEQFFEGNDDPGSIWCNLEAAPEPREVYQKLKTIREREDCADVRIKVTQFDGGDDEWPFSDTVFFITSAAPEDVQSWLGEEFAPDEIDFDDLSQVDNISVPSGMNAIAAWWD